MTRRPALDDRTAEALLSGTSLPGHEDLAGALSALTVLPAAPAPSALLARMLSEGLAPVTGPVSVDLREPARPRRRWAAVMGVVVASATAGLLTAATANALPAPAQRVVSDVVGAVTPFDLPSPPAFPTDPGPVAPGAGDDADADVRPTEPVDADDTAPGGGPADDKHDVDTDTGSDDAKPDDSESRTDDPVKESTDAPSGRGGGADDSQESAPDAGEAEQPSSSGGSESSDGSDTALADRGDESPADTPADTPGDSTVDAGAVPDADAGADD